MDRTTSCSKVDEAIANIQFNGELVEKKLFGSGHINDTFLATFRQEDGHTHKCILQRMNHKVFQKPDELMENIWSITEYLKRKIIEQGGDPQRETLSVIPTKDGKSYYRDSIGCYWRGFQFIEDAVSFDRVEKPEQFYQSAVAFGRFQNMLADYPAETLHETIPNFHNTPARLDALKEAVKIDVVGRVKDVREELDFIYKRRIDARVLMDMLERGELPLRVTHNDTKLNNVMIDNVTGKSLCVVDLDTVMPGLALNDYGDSIRFGACTAAEDEPDLSKVWLDLNLFESYTKGFLDACGDSLTEKELDMLPMGAKIMTLECGIRFLTDYIQGDTYFKIHREHHNLERCRTQLKLVADMERKWSQMVAIVDHYRSKKAPV